ncbi:26S proteasome non-ATPase regulatory subunit 10 isoform X3 [Hydra vulgaris]|uniref:26S proteasome non-ATPase regulatory subunit 10 isoform X3 n=1 Tax=Hydra vulgaris TaxID=6087 RepID=A0ABM4CCB7_HYDVU
MSVSNNMLCQYAYDGNLEGLKDIICAKKEVAGVKDQDERQPLHWACSAGHLSIVQYLLNDCNVPIDQPDDSGWTPLIIASSAGRDLIVKELLRNSADPNKQTSTGCTALHYAASKNRYEIAQLLITSEADVNIQDRNTSASPLHRAASLGNIKIVNLLLDHNCKIDIQDSQGNTPLHLACEEERADVAELLHRHGASLVIQNKNEKTPTDLCPPYLKRRLLES